MHNLHQKYLSTIKRLGIGASTGLYTVSTIIRGVFHKYLKKTDNFSANRNNKCLMKLINKVHMPVDNIIHRLYT